MKARIIILVGGAEPMDKSFDEMNKSLLTLLDKNSLSICYVPLALFNNESMLSGMNSYIDQIQGYYRTIDKDLELTRVKFEDSNKEIIKKLQQADVIYLSGGSTEYLINQLNERGINKTIIEEYNNGKIIIGNSAGALALLGDTCSISEKGEPRYYKGIGLINDVIAIVHYSESLKDLRDVVSKKFPNKKIFEIKETDALLFIDGEFLKNLAAW
jgi:dipeptidase E